MKTNAIAVWSAVSLVTLGTIRCSFAAGAEANGAVSAVFFGAKADGVTDDTVAIQKMLQHAIVTENNGVRGVTIKNEVGERAVIANNEPSPK